MAQVPQNPEIIELSDGDDDWPSTFPNNTTQENRFAVFTKIAKKEHTITLDAKGANQGVFADLFMKFPQLKFEVDKQWYEQNVNNTELELCKSTYHGIVNARTTTFMNPCIKKAYDSSTVNVWWVVNLFDVWQGLLGRAKAGDRVLARAFGHALSGQQPLQMEGLSSVQAGSLMLGGQYEPDALRQSIENDDNKPGPLRVPSLPRNQAQQPYTKLGNSSTKQQGHISNAVQTPIDNIPGPPNKRVKFNNSDPRALRQGSASIQTRSQVSNGNDLTIMSNQERVSHGFGPNPTLSPTSKVPTNNRSKQTRESTRPVQSMSSSNDCTQAPTRMGMPCISKNIPIQLGSQAGSAPSAPSRNGFDVPPLPSKPSESMTSQPRHFAIQSEDSSWKASMHNQRSRSQPIGPQAATSIRSNLQNNGMKTQNAATLVNRPANAQMGHGNDGITETPFNDSSYLYGQPMQKSISLPSTSLVVVNSCAGSRRDLMREPVEYPSGMHDHYATPNYSFAQFTFESQDNLQVKSMRDPSVNSQFDLSSSQGSGFMESHFPVMNDFQSPVSNAPASTANGSHTTSTRDVDTCEAQLKAEYEANVARYFLSEKQRLKLKGYDQAILCAYRSNNWNRIAQVKLLKQSLLEGLQTSGNPQQNNDFAQSSVHAGANASQHVHSNSTQSTALQNTWSAQPLTFVPTGIDPNETHRLMEVEYEDTCRRLGPFNDEEKRCLQRMFGIWGDALIRNDTAAAYLARSTIRACRPGHIGSISTLLHTPKLAAAPPNLNQRVYQTSAGIGYLPVGAQLSG
jgi:hypothetical protein